MKIHDLIRFYLQTPVTYTLMITIFIISLVSFYYRKLFAELLLHPYSVIKDGEYYRMLSSDLVHNDFAHLIINEICMYVMCTDLEELIRQHHAHGSIIFTGVYLICMLTGAGIVTWRHGTDFGYSSAGPSGSIMGCMFCFMLLNPWGSSLQLPFFGRVQNIYCGILYILALLIYRNKSRNSKINIELHFFGALGGILAAGLMVVL